jgi:diguanylate cyclase (GGDEF)-like protein
VPLNPASPPNDRLIRRGILTYILALSLIAIFSIAFHVLADSIVRHQQDTAAVVNLSGRQRMLSQRIAKIALERAAHARFRSDQAALNTLNTSIAQMESAHQALLYGSPALHLQGPASRQVMDVYTRAPWNLNERMTDFLAHAHALAARPSAQLSLEDPDLDALEKDAQAPLLDALNAAVTANQDASEHSIRVLRHVLSALTATMLLLLLLEAVFLYRPLFHHLAHAQQNLLVAGRTDPLTGCLNRRAFTQEAAAALAHARDNDRPLAVLMLDIDRFKSVNDLHGHPFGDTVINAVVHSLLQTVRTEDTVCRMGGEEFAIMLPNQSLRKAAYVAERVRLAVSRIVILPPDGTPLALTISLGAATLEPSDETLFDALGRADRALYNAKSNGRNRVESEPALPPLAPGEALPTRRIRPA